MTFLAFPKGVHDLCKGFRDGKLPDSFDDDGYYNVRTIQEIGAE